MRFSYIFLLVGVLFLVLGFFAPQVSFVEGPQTNGLSTNQYFPSDVSNLSYSIHLQETQKFFGFPFNFHTIYFNHNEAIINGQAYGVHTLTNISKGIVTITIWLKAPVSSGSVQFVFNFVADYIIDYGGFTSTNYLKQYQSTSQTFYFAVGLPNYINVAIGGVLVVVGAILFVKRR